MPCTWQWRSKALRGSGSTLTWGPSLPPPPLPPLPPLPLPFHPVPQPSPLPRSGPQIQLEGLGEHCKLPQQGLGGDPAEIEFNWCIALIKSSSSGNNFNDFLRVLPKIFLWPHYSGSRGPQELGGTGSSNRLDPLFLRRPLVEYRRHLAEARRSFRSTKTSFLV